ncbi:hypothetical protein JB92DRAFT_3129680 [Gautieria morchelliformis]|nr:hypothetical protein JB92DRAFT_3129680 [Gautieria morchelliformis]
MSPHNSTTLSPHTALPIVQDTARMPQYKISRRRPGEIPLTKLLHASRAVLPSFFCRFNLLSAHSNILRDSQATIAPIPLRTPQRRRELPTALPTTPRPEVAG